MSIIKKLLIFPLILGSFGLFANKSEPKDKIDSKVQQPIIDERSPEDVINKFHYFSFQNNWVCPYVGLGYRSQKNHHGYDIGLNVMPLIFVNDVNIYANYLYYFKPSNNCGQTYIGTGVRAGAVFRRDFALGYLNGPSFILGKEFRSKKNGTKFVEVSISPLMFTNVGICGSFPVEFKVGFSF